MKVWEIIKEQATVGATSTGSIATNPVANLQKRDKQYTGSPGKSGTKPPKTPKIVQAKNADGTAKNGLDSDNIFGGKPIKRA